MDSCSFSSASREVKEAQLSLFRTHVDLLPSVWLCDLRFFSKRI